MVDNDNASKVIVHIETLIEEELPKLPPHLRIWAKQHLVEPRRVLLSRNEDGTGEIALWLVTDHIGKNDSTMRVVFDEIKDSFGLEMAMTDEIHWFMGFYGDFAKAVQGM